jgi:hypothetical protein
VPMSDVASYRLPGDVIEKLKEKLRNVVTTLRVLRSKLPLREELSYALQLSAGSSPAQLSKLPTLGILRTEESFRSLFHLALDEPSIWSVLLNSLDPTVVNEDRNDTLYREFIEFMLLRIGALLELKASSYREGTKQTNDLEEQLENLISFLGLQSVERHVLVPLLNIEMCCDKFVIAKFGHLDSLVIHS